MRHDDDCVRLKVKLELSGCNNYRQSSLFEFMVASRRAFELWNTGSRAPSSSRMMVELIAASDFVKHANRSSVASSLDSWKVMSGTSLRSLNLD